MLQCGGKSHLAMNATHALEVVFGQITQTNGLEEVLLPALLAPINTNGNVALLADGTAKAACLVAGSYMGQGISKIIEFAAVEKLLGHIVL